jgi:hypothetical protein
MINNPQLFFSDWKWRIKLIYFFYWGKGKMYPVEYKRSAKHIFFNGVSLLPNNFAYSYLTKNIEVYISNESNLYYVLHEGKKLYFKRGLLKHEVVGSYRALLMEQDCKSPHKYTSEFVFLKEGSILYDIGSAEGIFTLSHIEKIGHAYLFECEEDWIEALENTFLPWKGKITIIKKYVSNRNNDREISIDEFCKNNYSPGFIKLDIEGAELSALKGSFRTLKSTENIFVSVCIYHRHEDEKNIQMLFDRLGYKMELSEGLMFVEWEDHRYPIKPPYFRRGVLRAKNN